MSAAELNEHAAYLSDSQKIAAYGRAIAARLQDLPAARVLDLGAGTGVLGLLAARAGAQRVYAVDSGSIIGPAAEVAEHSGFVDRIVHVRGRSTDIDLPEPVDIAVCDQIGGFVYDAGVLDYFADVRRRLLAPGGALIPARFRMFLAPAECAKVREQLGVWTSSPAGFDFSAFRQLAINTEHRVSGDEVRLLAAGAEVGNVPADHTEPIKGSGEFAIEREGTCDGLVGFFEAELGDGITLTNRPGDVGRMNRWCNLYPISRSVPVAAGHRISAHVDVRPLLPAITWRVTIRDGDTVLTDERHSTLLGTFLAPDDLRRAEGRPIVTTPVGAALAEALRLADGSRSTDEVFDAVRSRVTDFPRSPSVEHAVRDVIERFTVPTR